AESKDRDPKYATAMADPSMDLTEYGAPKGEYLTLDAKSALEVKYSEGSIKHRTELLEKLNLEKAEIVETETTVAEEVARFLTNPVVVPILLSIASLGFIVELYSDRKSTRLNSSHVSISYAVFCLKKKIKK